MLCCAVRYCWHMQPLPPYKSTDSCSTKAFLSTPSPSPCHTPHGRNIGLVSSHKPSRKAPSARTSTLYALCVRVSCALPAQLGALCSVRPLAGCEPMRPVRLEQIHALLICDRTTQAPRPRFLAAITARTAPRPPTYPTARPTFPCLCLYRGHASQYADTVSVPQGTPHTPLFASPLERSTWS